MSRNQYISGQWNVICDSCGKKVKAGEIRKRWDGLMVCSIDYEQRHPQDFVRARQDKISIPYSRPRPLDIFINTSYPLYCDAGYYVSDMNGMQYILEEI